ncbi:hypothetical protein SGGBAA2069_c23060 [Streptococcus gallolyticus subsp. gallolyticus ATCC BAA-2069]|nr:hypothetical protein SGGBAA2069_c23060 [Streptococcus gallolyticus subsp. gallolyticus ATCC BAA-2069]
MITIFYDLTVLHFLPIIFVKKRKKIEKNYRQRKNI